MPLRMLIGVLLLGSVLTIGIAAAVSNGGAATYSGSEVRGAFGEVGLMLRPTGGTTGGEAFMGGGDRYTVLVISSVAAAEQAFLPYEGDVDPATFEARKGNVVVLADGSNNSQPLPSATRTRIRTALGLLGE